MTVRTTRPGGLETDALLGALTAVVERHEALRTSYRQDAGRLLQHIALEAEVPFRGLDFTDLPASGREARPARLIEDELRLPIHLARQPPLRAVPARVGPADHLLIVVVHHIAFDGMSWHLLGTELAAGYRERTGGAPAVHRPPRAARPPVRPLRRLAGREAHRPTAGRRAGPLAHRARGPDAASAAHRPPPPGRLGRCRRRRPLGAAGRADGTGRPPRPPQPGDPVHGAARRVPGGARPVRRAAGHRGRHAGERPRPARCGAADRPVRQHRDGARRPERRTVLPDPARPGRREHAGRPQPRRHAVRTGG
ncbi:hypothetical protein JHN54_31680 [Streptomyces sp. MBT70]|nr:hypothetical protein [Streptomyces sp. MBT70]